MELRPMNADPIITSNSPIAARLVGLDPGAPFIGMSLPLSVWMNFAQSANITEWRSLMKLPLAIRETVTGVLHLVDADDAVIATTDVKPWAGVPIDQQPEVARANLERIVAAVNSSAQADRGVLGTAAV